MNKEDIPEDMLDFSVCVGCDCQGSCCCEPTDCLDCDDGTVISCPDDLCRNGNHCMHRDGEYTCSTCDGEGQVYPEKISFEEWQKRKQEAQKPLVVNKKEDDGLLPTDKSVGIRPTIL